MWGKDAEEMLGQLVRCSYRLFVLACFAFFQVESTQGSGK